MCFYICTAGIDGLDCGPHSVMLLANSMTASLNLSIIDDQDAECDEKFTATISIGADGNSSAGFILGPTSTLLITVIDNEGDYYSLFCGINYIFVLCML